jgi:hypothetical protein
MIFDNNCVALFARNWRAASDMGRVFMLRASGESLASDAGGGRIVLRVQFMLAAAA